MKTELKAGQNPSIQALARATEDAFKGLGESAVTVLLGEKTIGTSMTPIAHGFKGGTPRWRIYNKKSFGDVIQTQPPDAQFLYLIASSTVICGIEVF